MDAAMGRRPGTVLLRNAALVNVLSGETYAADILLAGRLIAAIGPGYQAETEYDLAGRHVTPGLIDGHLHLESAMVQPAEYAGEVVPRGVTAVVADPHEIANVLGMTGVQYILEATENLPLDVFVTASSCVPSTDLETAGSKIDVEEIDWLLTHPRVVGVAELMNFPGIVGADPLELSKALLADKHGKLADGHSPRVRGRDLNAYLASGISSDHESSDPAEAREKLRLGAMLMLRESSAARNLDALLPLVRPENAHQVCFVTDDRDPGDLMQDGGVDCLVRRAIARGMDPALAVRLGSLNTARHFRLPRRGAIAPGYIADLVVLEKLHAFRAGMVFKAGRLIARDGRLTEAPHQHADPRVLNTVRLPAITAAEIALPEGTGPVRVIELVPGEILTRQAVVTPAGSPGPDPGRDLAKFVVIERHGRSGGVGVGLLKGLGLRRGALASTVGHDSHNLLIAGISDDDILLAADRVNEMGGGLVVVADGREMARCSLAIAGLMSTEPLAVVRDQLAALEAAAGELGVTIPAPFMALSFLALPVIPELKLTDRGLVHIGPDGLTPVPLHLEEARR